MSDLIVGIDLGTTNSEVAAVRDRAPAVLADDGDPILPSVVGLAANGRLLVGHAARNQYVVAPERTVKSIKRRMGEDTTVSLGEQKYRPQEISAMILRSLRDRAARRLGRPVAKAVITVPAYFNDAQRQATREAGELAGLEVVRILNEPTAAALAYDPGGRDLRRVLVYDLGGGTFDVSVVAAEGGVVEVLASHGDTHLGGDDFDDLLLTLVCERFADEHGIDLRHNRVANARLLRSVEAAKRQLSDHPFARVEEEFVAEKNGLSLHLNQEISRDEYESLIRPLIDRTMDCVQRALDDAALTGRAIDQVVLVGGSTRTPLIAHLLEDRLGQAAHKEVNPDLIVAMGAALRRGRRRLGARRRDAALARHQVPGRRRRRSGPAVPAPLRPDHRPEYSAAGVAERGVPYGRGRAGDGRDRRLPGGGRGRAAEPPRRPVPGRGAGPGRGRQPDRRAA
jgi:molecular chaperone DnaK